LTCWVIVSIERSLIKKDKLYLDEESDSLSAIQKSMIIGEGEVHHLIGGLEKENE
jgi:hypothetical protein